MAHILIVDDEPFNCEVAGIICQAAGHRVTYAADGHAALEVLERDGADLLLVDFLMPVMDGLVLTRHVRSHPRFAALPIVGVTARAETADRERLLAAGMNQVLGKPLTNQGLRQVLQAHLG